MAAALGMLPAAATFVVMLAVLAVDVAVIDLFRRCRPDIHHVDVER